MGELSNLPNIGKEVERQLNETGIFTYEELKATGTEKTWLKIQAMDPSAASIVCMLWKGPFRE